MTNVEPRLIAVFEGAFPDLASEKIPGATQDNTNNWDSVAAITLMNLIEEEFQIQMDFEDLADLTSFERIKAYIEKKVAESQA